MSQSLPSVGNLLAYGRDALSKHWRPTLRLTVPIIVLSLVPAIYLLLPYYYHNYGAMFLWYIFALANGWYLLTLFNYFLRVDVGEPPAMKLVPGKLFLKVALVVFVAFIPVSIVSFVFALSLLADSPIAAQALGSRVLFLVAFITIPGIWIAVRWVFIGPVMLEDGKGVWTAMKTSANLVKGHWWKVFGRLFTIGLIFGIVFTVVGGIVSWLLSLIGLPLTAMQSYSQGRVPGTNEILGYLIRAFVQNTFGIVELLIAFPIFAKLYHSLKQSTAVPAMYLPSDVQYPSP